MKRQAEIARLCVDFAELALDGMVTVPLGKTALWPGRVVELFDDDGNTCLGVVKSLAERVAWIGPIV